MIPNQFNQQQYQPPEIQPTMQQFTPNVQQFNPLIQQYNTQMQQHNLMIQQQQQQQQMMLQQQQNMNGQINVQQMAYAQPNNNIQFYQANVVNLQPPNYSTVTSQEFKKNQENMLKQYEKRLNSQQKQIEKEKKAEQFRQHQLKLKSFNEASSKKLDADTLINSIIDKSTPNLPETQVPSNGAAINNAIDNSTEEEFSDFLQCSTLDSKPSPSSSSISTDNSPVDIATTNINSGEPSVNESKDLISMMMECSDLSGSQKARPFHKKISVNEMPKNVRSVTFSESRSSRKWISDDQQLTDLFTLPADSNSTVDVNMHSEGSVNNIYPSGLPNWATGNYPVPELYSQVLEAVSRDGAIRTDLVYPILLQSDLSQEMLGHLWSLVNLRTPGSLVVCELYMLLALVCIAQNKMDVSKLDVLSRYIQPPIPMLGQTKTSETSRQSQSNSDSFSQTNVNNEIQNFKQGTPNVLSDPTFQLVHQPIQQTHTSHDIVSSQSLDDDFQDFKQAPISVVLDRMPEPDGQQHQTSVIDHTPSSLSKNDKFESNVSSCQDVVNNRHITQTSIAPVIKNPSTNSLPDLIGEEDRYSALRSETDQQANFSTGFANFSLSSNLTEAKSDVPSSSVGFPGSGDDFTDFESPPSLNTHSDKLSALKELVNKSSSLYLNKANNSPLDHSDVSVNDQGVKKSDLMTSEGEWEDFKTPDNSAQPVQNDLDFFQSKQGTSDSSNNNKNWADFNLSTLHDSSDFSSNCTSSTQNNEINPTEMCGAALSNGLPLFPDETDVTIESKNCQTTSSVHKPPIKNSSFVVSPFEVMPPPDDICSNQDSAVDEVPFAAYQGFDSSEDNGVSSLSLHLNGLDVSALASDKKRTEENLNSDFVDDISLTDSKSTDDHSLSSSDNSNIKNFKIANIGTDSQSVSSAEFNNIDINLKVTSINDDKSVASLDLRQTESPNTEVIDVADDDDEELFRTGEFPSFTDSTAKKVHGSASVNSSVKVEEKPSHSISLPPFTLGQPLHTDTTPLSVHPAKESVADSSSSAAVQPTIATVPIADRYSGLAESLGGVPEDTECDESHRHLVQWRKCVDHAHQMVCDANRTLTAISSAFVCSQVLKSEACHEYLKGIVEIYRVLCRIYASRKHFSINDETLSKQERESELVWENLSTFVTGAGVYPPHGALDFSQCSPPKNADEVTKQRICGVCLLDVNACSRAFSYPNDQLRLTFSGRQYHASCANFWVNCIGSTLPALRIPELL